MKSLIAFVLACLVVGIFESMLAAILMSAVPANFEARIHGTRVYVHSDSEQTATAVRNAIKALKLPRVSVYEPTSTPSLTTYLAMLFKTGLSLFFTSGLVFVAFKNISRWLKTEPLI